MVLDQAKKVLKIEAEGILGLMDRLDASFERAVELIYAAKGRLVVTGIGKSGIVGQKIVATLNSTGTRALFLHPVEALHGDLGMVGKTDVFLALSNSGETEVNILIPTVKAMGCPVIAFTGRKDSTLGRQADVIIDTGVPKEACPLNLAPTASTTAQIAMGDALAVALINKRSFKKEDFQKFHPGGWLGKRLSQKVEDLMLTGKAVPQTKESAPLTEAIAEMDRFQMGAVLVTDGQGALLGIITDGDLRRFLIKTQNGVSGHKAKDVMTQNPKAVSPNSKASDALNLMERHLITVLPITGKKNVVLGILHLHDILGKGEFAFNGA